jgi:hypothetical protein
MSRVQYIKRKRKRKKEWHRYNIISRVLYICNKMKERVASEQYNE